MRIRYFKNFLLCLQLALLLSACQNRAHTQYSSENNIIEQSIGQSEIDTMTQSNISTQSPETDVIPQSSDSEELPEDDASPQPSAGEEFDDYEYKSNDGVNYNYHNGLEYFDESLEMDSEGRSYVHYIRIEGLKDELVQQKINDRIKQEAAALYVKELPPYRGIKRFIVEPTDWEPTVFCSVSFNEANIFSIRLHKTLAVQNDYYLFVRETVPITFNLITGEELMLADLFPEGYDYQTQISEYVRSFETQNLLRPFERVASNQKFYIQSANEIVLILDYDTPEFVLDMEPQYLSIRAQRMPGSGKEFIFTERCETWDESLYKEGFRRSKTLRESDDVQQEMWLSNSPQLGNTRFGGQVDFLVSISRAAEQQDLIIKIEAMREQAEKRLIDIIHERQITIEQYDDVSYHFYADNYGGYLTIGERYSFWGDTSEYYRNSSVYNAATGGLLTLEDCFVRGYDYQKLMREFFTSYYPELSEAELLEYLEHPNFEIGESTLEVYWNQPDGSIDKQCHFTFEEIGEENINLFH